MGKEICKECQCPSCSFSIPDGGSEYCYNCDLCLEESPTTNCLSYDNVIDTQEKNTLIRLVESLIEDKDVLDMTIDFLENKVPRYFWIVPASSTGKYHPAYALGKGGLARHTIAALKILSCMLSTDGMKALISPLGRDCMFSAIALHDTAKCGTQEQYENDDPNKDGSKTKNNHELLVDIPFRDEEATSTKRGIIKFAFTSRAIKMKTIHLLITTRMGQGGAENPASLPELLVHTADLLASRKFISVETHG